MDTSDSALQPLPSDDTTEGRSERYELGEVLGSGGQGNTYRAVDRESGDTVAVKVLALRGSTWKGFDLFERECDVLATLDHPGIPHYRDRFADEEAGRYGLVMELVEGQALSQAVKQKVYPSEPRLWGLLEQSLEILDYLHGLRPPVIHRDLKPANLLERPDGSLALVDFGGVRATLRPEGGSTVVGTFGYMAPEQLHGEALPATDIYALGATLTALAMAQEADRLPRSGLKIDLEKLMTPGPLRDVLDAMVEPDPAKRLADVAAVRAIVERCRGALDATPAALPASTAAVGPTAPAATALAPTTAPPGAMTPAQQAPGLGSLIGGVITAVASLGFGLVEVIALPLIFTLLSLFTPRSRQPALKARQQRAKERLQAGRQRFHQRLAAREQRRRARALPPGQESSSREPRQLPPQGGFRGGGWGRDGGRRGGRHGRRGRRPR